MPLSISVKNIKSEFLKAQRKVNKQINQEQRISAFRALDDIRRATPIDTGRASKSWLLTKSRNNLRDAIDGIQATTILGPVPTNSVERLYFTNGTPYIEVLNRGSSQQAPPRFIEQTLGKYFRIRGSSIRTT